MMKIERGSNLDRYSLTDLLEALDDEIRSYWHVMHTFRKEAAEARAAWMASAKTIDAPFHQLYQDYNHKVRCANTTEGTLRALLAVRKAGRG